MNAAIKPISAVSPGPVLLRLLVLAVPVWDDDPVEFVAADPEPGEVAGELLLPG